METILIFKTKLKVEFPILRLMTRLILSLAGVVRFRVVCLEAWELLLRSQHPRLSNLPAGAI